MVKNTFYFSHDYNARSDTKIKALLSKHGMAAYGLYWSIVEDLYQNENSIPMDYEMLSYDLRSDANLIKSIIEDFGLFDTDSGNISSISIERRMADRNKKSNQAKENAQHRWGKTEEREAAENCIFYVIRIYTDGEEFLKCGITTESVSRRYSGKLSGYSYDLIFKREMSVLSALELENFIQSKCENYTPKVKFGGYLECYNMYDIDTIKDIALQRESKGNAKNNFSNAIKERKGKENKGKETKEKERKVNTSSSAKAEPSEPKITSRFLAVYNDFLQKRTGTGEKFSVAGRKGLKDIIAYLTGQVKSKYPHQPPEYIEEQTVVSWDWILTNYEYWEPFHQNQLKLEQINSNILNIISSARKKKINGKQISHEQVAAESFAHLENLRNR